MAWNKPFKAKVTEKYDAWMAEQLKFCLLLAENGENLISAQGTNQINTVYGIISKKRF